MLPGYLHRVRRVMMLESKIKGSTNGQLMKEFNLSQKQLKNELLKAKQENLVRDIEANILERLATKALKLYDKALDEEDLFVAKDVLAQVHKIAERKEKKQLSEQNVGLALWLQARKEKLLEEDKEKFSGEIIEHPQQEVLGASEELLLAENIILGKPPDSDAKS